jgi:hypothetical protein
MVILGSLIQLHGVGVGVMSVAPPPAVGVGGVGADCPAADRGDKEASIIPTTHRRRAAFMVAASNTWRTTV